MPAVNLGWHDLPLGPMLADRLGVPVALENDVRAAAAGLHAPALATARTSRTSASEPGSRQALSSTAGSIAARGLCGEIGHVVLDADGPLCACGLRGCFEVLAAGPAVARAAEQAIAAGERSSLESSRPITAVDVYREAAAGDALALRIAETVGRHVAHAVHGSS